MANSKTGPNVEGDAWAYQWLRLALLASAQDDEQLALSLREFKDQGLLDEMLDCFLDAEERFREHADLLTRVLARSSVELERMGCHPD